LKAPTIKLYREFEQYQKNKGNLFWTQRAVQVSVAVTTNETTVAVQKAESKKAQLEYERQVVDSEKPSMENELIDDSDDSERDTESKSTSTGLFSTSHFTLR
jgi:serine protease inhibitor